MTHGVAQLLTQEDIMEIGVTFMLVTKVDQLSGISSDESVKTIGERVLSMIQTRAKNNIIPDFPDDK